MTAGRLISSATSLLTVVDQFERELSPNLVEMVTQVDGHFHCWPLSVMPPDYGWQTNPGVTIIGDSSHVMPPFTGKGVNLAMLDALELAEGLTAEPTTAVTTAIAGFEKKMQGRTRQETGQCLEVGRNIYGIHVDFGQPSMDGACCALKGRRFPS